MNLYKRGKVWWVEFVKDGERHRRSCNTTNHSVALAWVRSIETARRMPTFEDAVAVLKILYRKPAEGMIQVDSVWEHYLRIAKATGKDRVGEDTIRKKRCNVANFVAWLKESTPVRTAEAVNGPIAAAYAEKLAADGLKTKTRKNILGDLGNVWKLLEKVSTGVSNPWTNLNPMDIDSNVGIPFSPEDEDRVIEAARRVGKDWWQICTLMRYTGQRYSSVARFMWSEVEEDVIRHEPPKTRRFHIKVVLPIIPEIREAIESIRGRGGDYLFPVHAELYGRRGKKSKDLPFSEVLEAAGLAGKGYTIHSWRHSAASKLAEAGADRETRKAILGHTTDQMAERYDHSEHLAEKRRALEAAARVTSSRR